MAGSFTDGPSIGVEVRRDDEGEITIRIPHLAVEVRGDTSDEALAEMVSAIAGVGKHLSGYLRSGFDKGGVVNEDHELWLSGDEGSFCIMAQVFDDEEPEA